MILDSSQYSGLCPCGKEHTLSTVFSIVEAGCLKNIDQYMQQCGLQGYRVAVYDKNTYAATADRHPRADAEVILDPEGLHANEHGVALLSEQLPAQAQVLIAVGSGTIHDLTRYCAYKKGIDFVSCPTAASVDGFCSSVAAMTWKGCKKTLTAVAPKIVVADTDVIRHAPLRLARSGFGDMVGKYIALTDWQIGHILTGEFYCHRIADLTLEATKKVLTSANKLTARDPSACEDLMCGLLLSGLAMQMMGNSRPASGAEHHISHMIEMEPKNLGIRSDALHGEKVGIGTLLVMEEYHRLAALQEISPTDYTTFSQEELLGVFGQDMTRELMEENRADAAASVTGKHLRECWEAIRAQLNKLPDISQLRQTYNALEILSTLDDIGVSSDFAPQLLRYAPVVRNRLTLLRLRKMFL